MGAKCGCPTAKPCQQGEGQESIADTHKRGSCQHGGGFPSIAHTHTARGEQWGAETELLHPTPGCCHAAASEPHWGTRVGWQGKDRAKSVPSPHGFTQPQKLGHSHSMDVNASPAAPELPCLGAHRVLHPLDQCGGNEHIPDPLAAAFPSWLSQGHRAALVPSW